MSGMLGGGGGMCPCMHACMRAHIHAGIACKGAGPPVLGSTMLLQRLKCQPATVALHYTEHSCSTPCEVWRSAWPAMRQACPQALAGWLNSSASCPLLPGMQIMQGNTDHAQGYRSC